MKIPKLNNQAKSLSPSDFFGKLFQIRDSIHLSHLNVSGIGSYASHKALNEFYDEILDLTDDLIESYQGKYGRVNITIPESKTNLNHIEAIKQLVNLTDNGSLYNSFTETFIQNQLDEISKLCYQTLYKLEELK